MWFVNPAMWWWAAALAVPIVLYLVRHRPTRQKVATLLFFKSLAREHQEAAWLRRLKRLLSLLLTLAVIAAAVAALARPILAPPSQDLRSLVVVIDRSASMAAKDGPARTRLERAVTQVERRLAAVPVGVPVSLMVYDARPHILLARSINRREVLRELDRLEVRPIEGRPDPALRLAERLAAVETPATIWHVTDAAPNDAPDVRATSGPPELASADANTAVLADAAPPEVNLMHLPVARRQPTNVGITGFSLRRVPMQPDRFEAFVEVHAAGEGTVEAELELRLADELAGLRKLKLAPGSRERLLVPINARQGEAVRMHVTAKGDAMALDDQVVAWVPPLEPIRVLWVTDKPDPFTELAFRVLADDTLVEVYHAQPSTYPPNDAVDLVVFQGWMPERWPTDHPAIAIDPPNSSGPVHVAPLSRGGLPLEQIRATDRHHPLLFGVATPRVSLTQTVVLATDAMTSGLQPLWQGPSGPVLAAGDVRGQRIVVFAFAPELSENLPLMASYPMLIGNAIYWCTETGRQARAGHHHRTGELIEIDARKITWQPTGADESIEQDIGRWVELDRVGLWQTDAGVRGSAALLDSGETLLGGALADDNADDSPGQVGQLFAGDLTEALLALVLCVLLVESYLFHRHAVY